MEAPRLITGRSVGGISGVVVAPVVSNVDFERTGTVEVRLPWGQSTTLCAPVVAPGAGHDRGAVIVPKVGDNVVLAFLDGDSRRPVVLGGIWTGNDKAPVRAPGAADTQYVIRTRAGQEIRIDEVGDSITIRTQQGQAVECNEEGIQVRLGDEANTAVVLGSSGTIEIRATESITLKAPRVSIDASSTLELSSNGRASLVGDSACSIDGATVWIGS